MIRIQLMTMAVVLALSGAAQAQPIPANIAAALADPARPEAERVRDSARKPGDMLALAGVNPGDSVTDFIMGGGYFTRLLSVAVGPEGHVTSYQPAEFIAYEASYGEALKTVSDAYANVSPLATSLASIDLPDGQDLVMTVQNYHDLHLKDFPGDWAAKVNAEVFASLKPGGVFLVVDHEAAAEAGLEVADSLHRISPDKVKAEVEAAGFTLESESQLLDNPDDAHTINVFDPAIRGKTDQFILVFRKPS